MNSRVRIALLLVLSIALAFCTQVPVSQAGLLDKVKKKAEDKAKQTAEGAVDQKTGEVTGETTGEAPAAEGFELLLVRAQLAQRRSRHRGSHGADVEHLRMRRHRRADDLRGRGRVDHHRRRRARARAGR